MTYQLALQALVSAEGIFPTLPSYKGFLVIKPTWPDQPTILDDSNSDNEAGRPRKRRRTSRPSLGEDTFALGVEGSPAGDLPDLEPFPGDVKLSDIPKRCVERASPLVCVNQDIIDAIKPIYEDREFEELAQKNSNILSYRRSMSVRTCDTLIFSS